MTGDAGFGPDTPFGPEFPRRVPEPDEETGYLRLYTQEQVDGFVMQARESAAADAIAMLDLNDARTANAVADAITRYCGRWVMFSARYPWIREKAWGDAPQDTRDLVRDLVADPMQHEHVIDVREDGGWTLRHPLSERLTEDLFSCVVAGRVNDLGLDSMPEPGRYAVVLGETWVDFVEKP